MNILVVDDEEDIRNSLQQYLKIDEIDSDVAENGLSAQRMIKETPYDAILVDLKMPGMDGQQLIEWLRHGLGVWASACFFGTFVQLRGRGLQRKDSRGGAEAEYPELSGIL